jgi:ketosteroid isomerase-like protein
MEPHEPTLRALQDRAAIIDVITRFAVSLDRRDWAGLRACLADQVQLDYPDSVGVATVGGDDLVAIARRFFGRLDATQHVSANHQVAIDGDRASCTSTLLAQHFLTGCDGGETQRQVGYYVNDLARGADGEWRIVRSAQQVSWSDGNPAVFTHAAAAFGPAEAD